MKNKTKKAKVYDAKMVVFSELKSAKGFDYTFDSVSYGDAEYTLVWPAQLIAELEGLKDASMAPVIEELRGIKKDVYIALEG